MRAFSNPLDPISMAMCQRFYEAYVIKSTGRLLPCDHRVITSIMKDYGFTNTESAVYTILQGFELMFEEANTPD